MRKPVVIGLAVVAALLAGTAGYFFQQYRAASANYAALQTAEQDTRDRYGSALTEIAAIQDSLNAIVLGDDAASLVPAQLQAEQRLTETQGDLALARISVIRDGIERAKDRIQTLEASLSESGIKMKGLQRMIANLRNSVTEKETQVAALSDQVQTLETQVTGLTAAVEEKDGTIESQAATIETKRRELGTVYVAVATKKELVSAGVVEPVGGFLGLGKTLETTGHMDPTLFTPLDTDEDRVIRIPAAKAQVISDQPPSSYALELVGDHLELRILDAEQFRAVKHVVIMTT